MDVSEIIHYLSIPLSSEDEAGCDSDDGLDAEVTVGSQADFDAFWANSSERNVNADMEQNVAESTLKNAEDIEVVELPVAFFFLLLLFQNIGSAPV